MPFFVFRVVYLDYVLIEKGFVDDVVLGDLERRIDNRDNCNDGDGSFVIVVEHLNYHFTIST